MEKKQQEQVASTLLIATKNVWSVQDLAMYLGMHPQSIYRWTSTKAIPHYKSPTGGVFFNRQEIEAWLQSERVATTTELEQEDIAELLKREAV